VPGAKDRKEKIPNTSEKRSAQGFGGDFIVTKYTLLSEFTLITAVAIGRIT
jgi:hypothetical protein